MGERPAAVFINTNREKNDLRRTGSRARASTKGCDMDFTSIVVDKDQDKGITKIILNRPQASNALTGEMVAEIGQALSDADRNSLTRVVIITGNGKSFCAGADLKYFKEEVSTLQQQEEWYRWANKTMMNPLAQLSKPVIAAVNGACLGGGYEIMLACDLAIAAEDAIIADQHLNFGLVGPGGSTPRTTWLLGPRKAKEVILTGKRMSGREAERIGLVNLAVPRDQLESAAHEMATNLAEKSPVAMRIAKALINRALQVDFSTAEQLEIMSAIVNATSEDYAEGVRSFSEKRKPVFKGR
jgi:enoyl-CoA hydratase/carnithine racemase